MAKEADFKNINPFVPLTKWMSSYKVTSCYMVFRFLVFFYIIISV
ncbi:hypothetical protein LEP1GSC072_2500 [Leptospira noguchii str. Bonito]|nr:hypothetical protein LEP1GSC072_2500 [Leptospira noguchii str. Bonito]